MVESRVRIKDSADVDEVVYLGQEGYVVGVEVFDGNLMCKIIFPEQTLPEEDFLVHELYFLELNLIPFPD